MTAPLPGRVAIQAGEPDIAYLRSALARAGRSLEANEIASEVLAGGRSGQPVFALKALNRGEPTQSFVLKTLNETSARPRALGVPCVEPKLWQAGILQTL